MLLVDKSYISVSESTSHVVSYCNSGHPGHPDYSVYYTTCVLCNFSLRVMNRFPTRYMNSYSFLHNITKTYPLSIKEFVSDGNYCNAAIACIIRVAPPSWSSLGKVAPLPPKFSSVDDVLEYMKVNDKGCEDDVVDSSGLEILFIKRAMRPRDQWGGHVAWPGGFLNYQEDVVTAVQREVREELGVELGPPSHCPSALHNSSTGNANTSNSHSGNYMHLGAMGITAFGPKQKGLHPHVYLKMNVEKPEFVLEEKEVDAVMWVNLQHFLRCTSPCRLGSHTVLAEEALPLSGTKKSIVLAVLRVLGLHRWHFPCVRLPAPQAVHAYSAKYNKDEDWVVWGMTFNTLRRLLRHANGNKEYLALDFPYRTDNSVFNAFAAYFYKYYTRRHDCAAAPSPDTDKNLHRNILWSSAAGLLGVYGVSALAGVGIYSISTALITSAIQ